MTQTTTAHSSQFRTLYLLLAVLFNCMTLIQAQSHLEVDGNAQISGKILLGTNNIAVGNSSTGGAITTGQFNLFFGYTTGQATTSGRFNSFFGNSSGYNNTTGLHNTFIGNNAGYHNDTSSYNIAIGSDALRRNIGLSKNLAIGFEALEKLERADGLDFQDSTDNGSSYNLAIGYQAGFNTNGLVITAPSARGEITQSGAFRNSFIGHLAGYDNDDGHSNTYVGFAAGYLNRQNYNTILGTEAGEQSTSGNNVFVGHRAGQKNSGSSNVFIGKGAGLEGSSSASVFVGFHAGLESRGVYNTFIGFESGELNQRGTDNVFVGKEAGQSNIDGQQNTIIGSLADVESDDLIRATAIGYESRVNCTDCLVLGSPRVKPNVGIGTSTPAERFHVVKSTLPGAIYNANSIALFESNTHGYLNIVTRTDRESGVLFGNPNIAEAGGVIYNNPSTPKGLEIRTKNNATRMVIDSLGNVGIGRYNPSHRLHVNGDAVRQDGLSTWGVASDQRLKTNIRDFLAGMDVIEQINPKWFQYKSNNQDQVGVIAQDIQEIAPYMVYEFEQDGETFLGFNANALFYLLVNAVKEQQVMLDEKHRSIHELKMRQDQLNQRLEQVEARLNPFNQN